MGRLLDFFSSPDKWVQGHATKDGRFCLVGGFDYVHRLQERIPGDYASIACAHQRLYDALQARGYGSAVRFNDDPTRTFSDIQDVLREADI